MNARRPRIRRSRDVMVMAASLAALGLRYRRGWRGRGRRTRRIEIVVGAGHHLLDVAPDEFPRILRVIGVVAGLIDARHPRPPVLLEQLVRVAVARGERTHLGVVEAR